MGSAHGPTAPVLIRLQRDIHHYSLYQAVLCLLDQLQNSHPGETPEALYGRIRFCANPALGFASRDIEQLHIETHDDGLHVTLQLNLIALSGASSPLPTHQVEQALGDDEGSSNVRALLDLFNDRLQRLLLPIWQKYRYYSRFRRGASDGLSTHLLALAGLHGATSGEALQPRRLLPCLGLISRRAQSADSVTAVLRHYFRHAGIELEQCLPRRVTIPPEQRSALGRANSTLGSELVLGQQVMDIGGRFRVHLRQLDWNDFHRFLPPGSDYRPLNELLRFLLRSALQFDLQLHLQADEIRALSLGSRNACLLGWTTWLGHPAGEPSIILSSLDQGRSA
ncbi:MAG: type VI secretion system baseplate subunit TssG [Pseudomonadaceae bacterium]